VSDLCRINELSFRLDRALEKFPTKRLRGRFIQTHPFSHSSRLRNGLHDCHATVYYKYMADEITCPPTAQPDNVLDVAHKLKGQSWQFGFRLRLHQPIIIGAKGLRPQRASPDDDRPTKAGKTKASDYWNQAARKQPGRCANRLICGED